MLPAQAHAQALRGLPVLLAAALPALLWGQAAAQTPGASCVTGSYWCSITYTLSTTPSGTSPQFIGVNLGHKHPADSSWLAFMEHLGVNGARLGSAARCSH